MEVERLRAVYEGRTADPTIKERYRRANPGNTFNIRQREQALEALIGKHFGGTLADLKILDVGCAGGGLVDELRKYGVDDDNFWGVDLMPDRIQIARAAHPRAHFETSAAHQLPFADQSFDVVCQSTLMTSVLDPHMKRSIAGEMDRVLLGGGHVLWHDFWINPVNPDARGIRLAELGALFPQYTLDSRQITLAPPVARTVGRFGAPLCAVLAAFKPLRTHHLAVLTKPRS